MLGNAEILFNPVQKVIFRAALKHLGDENAARCKDFLGKQQGMFDQVDNTDMVGLAMAGGFGRHIGNHRINRPVKGLLDHVRGRWIKEIRLQTGRAGKPFPFKDIKTDDLATALFRPDHINRNLRPAARCRPKVDNAHARTQQVKLVVDFNQLEGRARTIAKALGFLHVRIVQLPVEPAGRGNLAPLRTFDARPKPAPCAGIDRGNG